MIKENFDLKFFCMIKIWMHQENIMIFRLYFTIHNEQNRIYISNTCQTSSINIVIKEVKKKQIAVSLFYFCVFKKGGRKMAKICIFSSRCYDTTINELATVW